MRSTLVALSMLARAGAHRYIFTVHALKTDKIEVPADASAALVGLMLNANRLAKASFEARYGRK